MMPGVYKPSIKLSKGRKGESFPGPPTRQLGPTSLSLQEVGARI
jgi:hypothetical protein